MRPVKVSDILVHLGRQLGDYSKVPRNPGASLICLRLLEESLILTVAYTNMSHDHLGMCQNRVSSTSVCAFQTFDFPANPPESQIPTLKQHTHHTSHSGGSMSSVFAPQVEGYTPGVAPGTVLPPGPPPGPAPAKAALPPGPLASRDLSGNLLGVPTHSNGFHIKFVGVGEIGSTFYLGLEMGTGAIGF